MIQSQGLQQEEIIHTYGKFFLIGDAIEGQYVANNLHFAAAIAFILMVILLIAMALMKHYTDSRVAGGV